MVIKIIATILLGLGMLWLGVHEGKTLSDKVSNKQERQWLSAMEIISMLAICYVTYDIWN